MSRVKLLPAFYLRLIRHPVPLVFAVAFVAAKVWSNATAGAGLVIGARSGVMGLLFYGLGAGVIYVLSPRPLGSRLQASRADAVRLKRLALPLMLLVYVLILGSIVDRLQRLGYIDGGPIYDWLPGYNVFIGFLEKVTRWQAPATIPGLRDFMLPNILWGQVIFVLIPVIILVALGLRPGGFGLAGGAVSPALPFLGIYILAFLSGGLNAASVVLLMYSLLYPAVCEEFFFRGVLQPLFTGALSSAAWGMGLSALLFATLHFPDYVFRVYAGSLPLALGNVASVALFGLFMSYGVYRTGMLWPWMLVHAISNVVGW